MTEPDSGTPIDPTSMLELLAGGGTSRKTTSSLRGPSPPALVCPSCNRVIHEYWQHPLLQLAVKKGWYAGPTTGGTAVCDACNNAYMQGRTVERHAQRIDKSGLPLVMQTWTLNTYPGSKSHLKLAEAWLDAERKPDVVLYGPPGTAKTGLCVAMIRQILDRNQSAKFVRSADLALQLRASYAKPDQSELATLAPYLDASVLVLDDLSAIRKSEFFEDTLWTLIDARQKNYKPTLMTVNLTKDEREKFFGPVLYDRLRESAQWWHMDGLSVRKVLKFPKE